MAKIGRCSDCSFFEENDLKYDNWLIGHHEFVIGSCNGPAEDNFDCRDMKSDQMAVTCGHDGGIYVGENFGCVHFVSKG